MLEVMDEYGGEAGSHPRGDVEEEERQKADELLEQCRLGPHPSLTDVPSQLLQCHIYP